ncbi:hypothetical protein A3K93_06035 [Acinetobacter sp. NCu2D-2]|uniref:zinc-binding metallopeptidase family protein n=1 Tax=Acinetobacter sp. NCu2D-2 TaxID=1608473 RepID=UPI0007CDF42B|nr:putative zinc-binding metallopeptidase [Acinetobacter sp. NCu2D-2]ANF81790.1 hypothetical protein A3K93_06035 [Acinetobacter sp. NCu2D-2]
MKYFECAVCQQQIFFSDTICIHCQSPIGFVASERDMGTFKKCDENSWQAQNSHYKTQLFKPCYNYQNYQVCNWMIPAHAEDEYCESCQLTTVIPNLDNDEVFTYWRRLEDAKRRFLYLAQRMFMLPRPKRTIDDPYGLSFEFLMPIDGQPVLTGHANGVITLNAIEADVVYRETTRVNMGENYRTLLGHFRHESGHYYLNLMQLLHPELIDEFRHYFGDERIDYKKALDRHYEDGAPENWQEQYISTYASSHPWEDWAETWAHYLHMMETMETAYYAGLRVDGNGTTLNSMAFKECPIGAKDFEHVLENWITLTFNLNSLNRSMGLEDAYPFQLSECVKDKLRFIHRHVLDKAFKSQ